MQTPCLQLPDWPRKPTRISNCRPAKANPLAPYLVTIARSGERKTTTDSLALGPVKKRENDLRTEHESAVANYENRLAAWKAERKIVENNKK